MAQPSAQSLLGPPPPPTASDVLGPPPDENPVAPWLRWPLGLASALGGGALTTLGIPGDLVSLANRIQPSWMDPIWGKPTETVLPTSSELLSATNALGLTQNPRLAPQSPVERYAQAAAGGLGSAIPIIATGGAATPLEAATMLTSRAAVPTYLSGAAGGVGGEFGHELDPKSWILPFAFGSLAGLGMTGLTSTIESGLNLRRLTQANEAAQQARQEALEAQYHGQRLNKAQRDAQVADAQRTFGISKSAAQHGITQFDLEPFAATLGEGETLQDAGSRLQDDLRKWLAKDYPDAHEAAWKPVNDAMPSDASGPMPKYASALNAINTKSGSLERSSQLLKPNLPVRLEQTLRGVLDAQSDLAGDESGHLPWSDIQSFRSILGQSLENPQIVKDLGAQNQSRLYGAVTDDMRAIAKQHGLGDQFDAANTESHRLYQIAQGPVGRIISGLRPDITVEPPPGKIAQSLLTGGRLGDSDLAILRQIVPDAVDNLASVALRQNLWSDLSPEAKTALIPNPHQSSIIEHTIAEQQAAKSNAGEAITAATEQKRQAISAAQAQYNTAQQALADTVRRTKLAAVAAKQALLPEDSAAGSTLGHGVQTLVGGGLGSALGTILLNNLSGGNPLVHAAIGDITGMAVPMAYRGVKAIIQHPAKLRGPVAALSAASNQLQPYSEEGPP